MRLLKIIYIFIATEFIRRNYWIDTKHRKVGMWVDKVFYIYLTTYNTTTKTGLWIKLMTLEHAWNKMLSENSRIQIHMHNIFTIITCMYTPIDAKKQNYANILNNFLIE